MFNQKYNLHQRREKMNLTFESFTYNHNSVSLSNFTLSVGPITLFDSATLQLSYANIYGLIGRNGMGKSSLLKELKSICDHDRLRVLYVEQELILNERTPVQYVLDSNVKLKYLQDRVNQLKIIEEAKEEDNENELFNLLVEAEMELESYNPSKEIAQIRGILHGLGLTNEMMETPCHLFSGGYQVRISLARSLYLEPDLLLLDEPTNHLDLEAIMWLGDYLSRWKKIAIIVSHNIGFIDECCSNIINIENQKLFMYRGNYYKFKSEFQKKCTEEVKNYEKFEKKLKEMKKKSTKKQVEEWLARNKVTRPERNIRMRLEFADTTVIKSNLISVNNVSFHYSDCDKLLFENITFGLDMDSKVALVGLNGSGKSTLFKLITGELIPSSGSIQITNGVKIGYYNQHFDQQLPMDKTPVEYLTSVFGLDHEIVRSYLGRINLHSSAHVKQISQLSGGQKARVAFIKLVLSNPHVLLLDEPTNHLDIETIEALIDCLESFHGCLLLISHEAELINRLNSKIWYLHSSSIHFIDSYSDYANAIQNSKQISA
jgi:ATP-binding cassette subfamily F protein 1